MSRPNSQETRSSLLLRVREHDDAAWREFFESYTPVIFGYFLRRGLKPTDAEDLTQETLIDVLRCIRGFDYQREKGRFRDWLGIIARRKMIRFWQSRQQHLPLEAEFVEGVSTDDIWLEEFQGVIVARAMENIRGHFEEKTWQAFVAVWVERRSAPEAAERLAIPIEQIYSSKSRVLKQLEAEVLRISDDCSWLHKP